MAETTTNNAVYKYLEVRPHPWRRQLYLRGRNMTVGQLVATMNANKWTPEEAAWQSDLPLEQVQEALAYFAENSALVNDELRQEKRRLQAKGYAVEPRALS
jgi:uncharacterized protein (DUF433 family)